MVKNNTNSAKILLNQTNVAYKCLSPFRESLAKKKNIYIGYTTTKLSRRLIYHLSENSVIKQHLIMQRNNSTDQITSSDVRKIPTNNNNNNNKRLQILEAIYIKIFFLNIDKIAFNIDTNILDIFL